MAFCCGSVYVMLGGMIHTLVETMDKDKVQEDKMKKLKIAIVTTTFFPQVGGAEYQIKWFAEELAKRGHEVYLFTPYEAEEYSG